MKLKYTTQLFCYNSSFAFYSLLVCVGTFGTPFLLRTRSQRKGKLNVKLRRRSLENSSSQSSKSLRNEFADYHVNCSSKAQRNAKNKVSACKITPLCRII